MNCSPYLRDDSALQRIVRQFPTGSRVCHIDGRMASVRGTETRGKAVMLLVAYDDGRMESQLPGYFERRTIL